VLHKHRTIQGYRNSGKFQLSLGTGLSNQSSQFWYSGTQLVIELVSGNTKAVDNPAATAMRADANNGSGVF